MSSSPRRSAASSPGQRRTSRGAGDRESLIVGVLLGVLLLAGLDAVPGPSLEDTRVFIDARGLDAVALLLVAVLVYANFRHRPRFLRRRSSRFALLWAIAFVIWWVLVVVGTVLDDGVSARHAVVYGRDLLIFPILLPLLIAPMREPGIVRGLLYVVVPAAALYSLIMAFAIVTGGDPTGLLHIRLTNTDLGLTRVYVSVFDLIVAAVPFGIGFVLFGQSPRARRMGAAVALLALLAVMLQLTRAVYLGLLVGLLVAGTVWLLASGEVARQGRHRWIATMGALAVGAFVLMVVNPGGTASTAVSGVAERVTTTFGETTTTKTVDYRQQLASTMIELLDDDWPYGMGFLHPAERYMSDLPSGDIRNPDVGVMNAVMTMGVVGAILVYLPLLYLLYRLLAARWAGATRPEVVPVTFGIMAWAVFALATSVSLVVLFRQTGLTLSAFIIAWGLATLPGAPPRRQPASAAQ